MLLGFQHLACTKYAATMYQVRESRLSKLHRRTQELRQYLCWSSSVEEDVQDTVVSHFFNAVDACEEDSDSERGRGRQRSKKKRGGKGKRKDRNKKSSKKKKKVSSSSSSSSSSDSSSATTSESESSEAGIITRTIAKSRTSNNTL